MFDILASFGALLADNLQALFDLACNGGLEDMTFAQFGYAMGALVLFVLGVNIH